MLVSVTRISHEKENYYVGEDDGRVRRSGKGFLENKCMFMNIEVCTNRIHEAQALLHL